MPSTLLAVPVKYLSTNSRCEADRLEDLRAAIGLVRGDAHLGHHLVEPLADRLDEAIRRFLRRHARDHVGERGERLEREIRVDRLGAVAREQREVVDFARRARLDDESGAGPQPLAHEVLMHRRGREQGRDRQQLGRDLAVGNDQDVVAQVDRVLGLRAQRRERGLHAVRAPRGRIADVELPRPERAAREQRDVADLLHRVVGQDRLLRLEAHRRIRLVDAEQVRPRPDERDEAHHELLADRVDRRIRHLREQLLEVAVEHLRTVGEHRQRRVVAHRADGFLAVRRHRRQDHLQVFLRVAERLLPIEQRHVGRRRRRGIGQRRRARCASARSTGDTASRRRASASTPRRRRCGPRRCRRAASCRAAAATS